MRENRLHSIWNSGGAAINGWLAIPNGFCAEVMAQQDSDCLTTDLQDGVVDYRAMVGMLQAVSPTATVPVVRVPWLERGIDNQRHAQQDTREPLGCIHRTADGRNPLCDLDRIGRRP